ncbi:zinc ribbon domain-containing protein [Streptococcus didelphis]|uniref:zinc ribbon domain-containing protein n=1 Tax=Streptococcus didelphis TaxID=102886 RepID=UPI00037C6512|nr:hypothetical protein [Streptococcus didelphis]
MKTFLQKKWVKISSISIGLLLFILLIFASYYYSKTNYINRYVKARSIHNGRVFENIKEYVIWDDNNEKITNDEALYATFHRINPDHAQEVKKQLKEADSSDQVYIKSIGRKFLVFPDYRIAMKPLSLTLKTNLKGVDILLNHKKVTTTSSEDFSTTLKRLPISDYTASISGTYQGKRIDVKKTYDGKDNVLDLSVIFKTFTVTSNLKDSELYFDDNRIGTLKEGQYQVSDYPVTRKSKAYVKKHFPDGELVSKKLTLADHPDNSDLKLDIDNLLTEEEAGKYLLSAFNYLLTYINTGQDDTHLAELFEQGANNDFYKGLKESIKGKMEMDQRKASSLSIPSVALNNLTQVGKETFLLDFSAVYNFMYDKATDPEKGTSGHITHDLNGKLTLKKAGSKYLISQSGTKNISVTAEKNNVKAPSVFPEALLGSWTGQKDDTTYTLTISEDGNIRKKVSFKDPKKPAEESSAKVTKVDEKPGRNYQLTFENEKDSAIIIIGGGIGGSGIKYAFGLHQDGKTLTPIIWQAGEHAEFDFSKPLPGLALNKE